jgi:glycosyltransferase involved in cell wall biosynthesis
LKNSSKLRLFIDAHCFDNEFQGTRTFIKSLYKQLVQLTNGIDYYIAASNIENLRSEFDFIPSATFIKYNTNNAISRIYFETPTIIKKYKIDVAHFQYISPFKKHCTYIVTTHDILFNDFQSEFSLLYRWSRNFVFKHSIQHADIKTTVSNYSRERLVFQYGLQKNDVHVIPNGVDERFYLAYDKSNVQTQIANDYGVSEFILFVSRVEPRKNHIMLLNAYLEAKLFEKGISLVFIGKTSIHSNVLDETIAKMPSAARKLFFIFEQVNEDALIKFYQAAKLFVYPSKAEGFGIPPLEAAALGIPVLCSNTTAMQDFDFFGPHLFDPENKNELASKMVQLLFADDKTNYNDISQTIKTRYSWLNSAEILQNLLFGR